MMLIAAYEKTFALVLLKKILHNKKNCNTAQLLQENP